MKEKAKEAASDTCKAPKLVLEDVIGVTTKSSVGLAADGASDKCVYLAGCVAVVYDVAGHTRLPFLVQSRPSKPLSCVALSRCGGGAYVAAGESGTQPAVLVWDCTSQKLVAELKGHRFGVSCLDFSSNDEHMVSVGFPHDSFMYLWDWRSGCPLAKIKASTSSSPIFFVRFSADEDHFITGGKKHFKFWTVKSATRFRSNIKRWALDGKPPDLGSFKGSTFIAVTSTLTVSDSLHINGANNSSLFALSDEGILCLFYFGFSIRKWIDLKVSKGFAVAATTRIIACACSFGVVRLIDIEIFKEIGSLQLSKNEQHLLKSDDPVTPQKSYASTPDAVACQFSSANKLVVVYGDHSLYIWHLTCTNEAVPTCVLVSHSACIRDVKSLPFIQKHSQPLASSAQRTCNIFSIATCSEDKTIRLWDFLLNSSFNKLNTKEEAVDQQTPVWSFGVQGGLSMVSCSVFKSTASSNEQVGFRSLGTSSDKRYLAVGDSEGNVHVYDLCTNAYTCFQEAHSADVLSLDFYSSSERDDHATDTSKGHYLLASGGRDGKINIYDIDRNLSIIQSLDDHSGAVSSLKFISGVSKFLSFSTDRSILFRDVTILGDNLQIKNLDHSETSFNAPACDMVVDPVSDFVLTVCQDKKINVFDISTGQFIRAIQLDTDFGEPIKVAFDPSRICMACSYTNRCVVIHDFGSGETIAQTPEHGEVITGVIFVPDYEHLITVDGDSCIFIWRLPTQTTFNMLKKISLTVSSSPSMPTNTVLDIRKTAADEGCEHTSKKEQSGFKFSISKLPKWAQTKVAFSSECIASNSSGCMTSSQSNPYRSCNVEVCSKGKFGCASDAVNSSQVDEDNSSRKRKPQWDTIYNVCLNEFHTPQLFNKSKTVSAVQNNGNLQARVQHPIEDHQIFEDKAITRNEKEIYRLTEALRKLDSAAEETLQSLARLSEVACQNDQLFKCPIFASEVIPAIKRKVDRLNDLISQRDNVDSLQ